VVIKSHFHENRHTLEVVAAPSSVLLPQAANSGLPSFRTTASDSPGTFVALSIPSTYLENSGVIMWPSSPDFELLNTVCGNSRPLTPKTKKQIDKAVDSSMSNVWWTSQEVKQTVARILMPRSNKRLWKDGSEVRTHHDVIYLTNHGSLNPSATSAPWFSCEWADLL